MILRCFSVVLDLEWRRPGTGLLLAWWRRDDGFLQAPPLFVPLPTVVLLLPLVAVDLASLIFYSKPGQRHFTVPSSCCYWIGWNASRMAWLPMLACKAVLGYFVALEMNGKW